MGLCQEEGLLMPFLFRGDLVKHSEPKIRSCFFIFADLEKAFHRVPGEVICFTLRRKGIPEYLLHGVMCLYKACKTTVSVDGGTIKFIFCKSWCPSRVCLESTSW